MEIAATEKDCWQRTHGNRKVKEVASFTDLNKQRKPKVCGAHLQ
jgi:hypothetical protein